MIQGRCIKEKKIFIFMMLLILGMQVCENISAKEHDNVKSINIYYSKGRNGNPLYDSNNQDRISEFSYYADRSNVIAYILHYIDSFEMIADGKNIQGGDLPTANIRIMYEDDSLDTMRFFAKRFVDDGGIQYEIDDNEYDRFFDFVYALKTEKLILPQNVSFEPSEWAKAEVDSASSIGLLPEWNRIGYANDITRLEVCQLADNFLTMNGTVQEITESQTFEDTKDPSVENLYALDIIDGMTETEFCPYDYITREEIAKILSGMCKTIGIDADGNSVDYADKDEISDWAEEYVNDMSEISIFIGDDENKFNPKNNITKEEFVILLLRLAEKLA